jgi:hypothetical protein
VFGDGLRDFVEFSRRKSVVGSKRYRIEPELCLIFTCFDMNMWWFLSFVLKK